MTKRELRQKTKQELLRLARRAKIEGRSALDKEGLVNALVRASRRRSPTQPRKRPAKPVPKGRRGRPKKVAPPPAPPEPVAVSAPEGPPPAPPPSIPELPDVYHQDRITLMVRDPYWAHAYWEITSESYRQAADALGDEAPQAGTVLRVYDITGVDFDGTNAIRSWDVEIGGADNWYLDLGEPDHVYCVEIGLRAPSGRFVAIGRSNLARTPRDRVSDVIDEHWMSREAEFERVYALSGGLGQTVGSPGFREALERHLREHISSGPFA